MSRLGAAGCVLALTVLAACTMPRAAEADLERGRLLYENHCMTCHTSKVHRRYPPSAIDRAALRAIVQIWAEEQKLGWTTEDIDDVARYVDRTHYRFPK